MYTIFPRQYHIARALGVVIKPSRVAFKKIAVYDKRGKKLCDIGDLRYPDYCTYLRDEGRAYADKRKKAYWARHRKDSGTGCGYWAARILWS